MSHFSVLIIGDDIEEQLAPYDEQPEGDSGYLAFNNRTDEVMEDWENGTWEKVVMPDGSYKSTWDEEFRVEGTFGTGSDTHKVPDELEVREVPYKELYDSVAEFAEEYHGYETYNGEYGYYSNPNAKWDWYSVGGRWSGMLKLKPAQAERAQGSAGDIMTPAVDPGWCSQARKSEIDFDGMYAKAEEEARERYTAVLKVIEDFSLPESWPTIRVRYEDNIEQARQVYNEQPAITALREARLDPFMDCAVDVYHLGDEDGLDQYINDCKCGAIQTFAVLKDGEWYEKGSMGWFGCVSDEKLKYDWSAMFTSLIDDLPDDTLLTIVDCHI